MATSTPVMSASRGRTAPIPRTCSAASISSAATVSTSPITARTTRSTSRRACARSCSRASSGTTATSASPFGDSYNNDQRGQLEERTVVSVSRITPSPFGYAFAREEAKNTFITDTERPVLSARPRPAGHLLGEPLRIRWTALRERRRARGDHPHTAHSGRRGERAPGISAGHHCQGQSQGLDRVRPGATARACTPRAAPASVRQRASKSRSPIIRA